MNIYENNERKRVILLRNSIEKILEYSKIYIDNKNIKNEIEKSDLVILS